MRTGAMKRRSTLRSSIVPALLACLAFAGTASARPVYFDTLKSHYAIADDSNLDACGVCHFKWTGTGARNPYGSTVEQQLYIGKSILQSIEAVENMDPDGDGYTSGDEIINFMTLPGYSCDNFTSAVGAPTGYDEYIEPNVPTCLDPLDIRVAPSGLGAIIYVGEVRTMQAIVYNNGSTETIEVTDYSLLPGAPAALSVSGPALPFSIPVGGNVTIDVIFAPTSSLLSNSTLRITSNDPDEGNVDIPVTVFAIADPTVAGPLREPCFATISKATAKYTKTHLRAWSDCYLEELAGRACDTGDRDYRIGKAAAKMASVIGGEKDKTCNGAGLTAASLGFPATCAPGCEDISIASVSDIPTCLVCMQDLVMEGVLRDGAGTAPPDLPPNIITDAEAYSCQERILKSLQKGLSKMVSMISSCELEALLADGGGTCAAQLTDELDELRASIDQSVGKCTVTTDLLGCRFEGMSPDPLCLGLAAEELAIELTNAEFALYE
jgi:hypothetical protein